MKASSEFIPLNMAVLTVSRNRTLDTDPSGAYLCRALQDAGHRFQDRLLVHEDMYQLRAVVSAWIADPQVNVILINGGTGFTPRDQTPQAVQPLFDMKVDGFGEMFRKISVEDIGMATMQSRALAGIANRTLVFCLPGSMGACQLAWERILQNQLDSRSSPCNFAGLVAPIE